MLFVCVAKRVPRAKPGVLVSDGARFSAKVRAWRGFLRCGNDRLAVNLPRSAERANGPAT